ncbi:MAG: dipeptide/oligopeptide/nickel ABC transporter ATP-binding protein [Tenericutes bacterium HGW-Tenericutes-1]|jgi:peptide/nickel transport system ATP-binding protein|nr:MAG: dipeptide/oligopeptide/nickel ABC transporter ATP-binding protein [Tenericutes bacterium HGW-Tenericutes-1]
MKLFDNLQKKIDKKKSIQKHYISKEQIKQTAKENSRIIKELEKQNNRKNVPEEEYLTKMRDSNNVVEFDDLHAYFFTDAGIVKAVDGVSFDIPKKSIVGVVGESGCGKSVTSLALMKLMQKPQGQIFSGEIRYNAKDGKAYNISKVPREDMNKIRGKEMSMIFQEPMTSLNPVFRIGDQLDEILFLHFPGITPEEAKEKSITMLKTVGMAMPESVYSRYPHELSGGMRQRVMIAMALSCDPNLIIADEPTTALDVTIQAQILDLLRSIKNDINGSIMLITHDLGVIAEMADYVVVMYAGRIIEKGTAREIYKNPQHPYTVGLQKSIPALNLNDEKLYTIPGTVPNPINMPNYCYFRDRCNKRFGKCDGEYPATIQISPTHSVACYLAEEIAAELAKSKDGEKNAKK